MTYKKVKSIEDIKNDLRIDDLIIGYDGRGKHMVECKTGFNFEGERTIDIGTIKEICYSINEYLYSNDENDYQR